MDRHDAAHTQKHTLSASQKFMTCASELMLALVHKGTILILIIGIKNSDGVVVFSGVISYQVSHTDDALSLSFFLMFIHLKVSP